MAVRRLVVLLLAACVVAGIAATEAGAAVRCGAVDPQTKERARATLTLDETNSVLSKAFARRGGQAQMLAEFRATGCEVPAQLGRVRHSFLPRLGANDIPPGAIRVARVRGDRARIQVVLSSDPQRFDPGTYGGYLELRAAEFVTARVPLEVSRSERSAVWPMLIGTIGGLAGLAWFALLSVAKGATTVIRRWHYALVFAAAAVAGMVTVIAGWLDQDVWTVGENGLAAAISAFTGATTGTMATAIAVLWGEPAKKG